MTPLPSGVMPSLIKRSCTQDGAERTLPINGLYKAELIHRCAFWKTREDLELATLEWVIWFNHHRLLVPLGYIPPAELSEQAVSSESHQLAS